MSSQPNNSEAWLSAIAKGERRMRRRRCGGGGDSETTGERSDADDYLRHLNDLLRGVGRERWNDPPAFLPPRPLWEEEGQQQHNQHQESHYSEHFQRQQGGGVQVDPYAFQPPREYDRNNFHGHRGGGGELTDEIIASSMMPMLTPASNRSISAAAASHNHFAAFDDGDSDDDDDEISDEEIVYRAPLGAGATTETVGGNGTDDGGGMSVRRILLRVYCSLAEMHSQAAVRCSRDRRWLAGADEFEAAFGTLRLGQEMLDEEHALVAQRLELTGGADDGGGGGGEGIANDTDVVSTMLEFFCKSREKYVHAAAKRVAYLEDKLLQEDEKRREIMSSMGSRWRNNPNPSNDHAERRKMLEAELEEALAGMNRTRIMDVSVLGK